MHEVLFKTECITRYALSRFFKKVHERELPGRLLNPIITAFEKLYGVESHEFDQRDFKSFAEYFTREFKNIKDLRPTGSGLVSPVDASNLRVQHFDRNSTVQVKATQTTLQDFTGFKLNNADYFAIHFYLSPKNYHRIHCPYESLYIAEAKYMSGQRLMIEKLDASFLTQNERACFRFGTEEGHFFYLVLTGAFCVGNILFSPTNTILNEANIETVVGTKFSLRDEMARFAFGSSTSLILPKQHFQCVDSLEQRRTIKLGESLCQLRPSQN